MADKNLRVNFVARDQGVAKTFSAMSASAEHLNKQMGGMRGQVRTVSEAFATFAAIDFFKQSIERATESQKVMHQTEAVIKSTGDAAGVTSKQVAELGDSISKKTGIDHDAIQSGENLLLTFTHIKNEAGKGNDIFDQTTKIMVDMSVAMGTDASSQAVKLGKALNDPIGGLTSLTRVGVQFTQGQKDQIKAMVAAGDMMGAQKIILDQLTVKFGGSAEAQATAAGKATASWHILQEEIGNKLLPVVSTVLNAFTELIQALGPFAPILVIGTAGVVGMAVATKLLKSGFTDVKNMIGGVVGKFSSLRASAVASTAALEAEGAAGAVAGEGIATGAVAAEAGITGLKLALISTGIGAILVGIGTALAFAFGRDKKADIEAITRALEEDSGAIGDNAQKWAYNTLLKSGAVAQAKHLGISLKDLTDASLGNSDALTRVNAALDAYPKDVFRGVPRDATDVTRLRTALNDVNGELIQGQKAYADEAAAGLHAAAVTKDVTNATDTLSQAYSDVYQYSSSTDAAAKSTAAAFDFERTAAQHLTSTIDDLRNALGRINGAQKSAAQASSDYQAAIDDLTKSLKMNGEHLSLNTDKGRSNQSAIIALTDATKSKAAADLAAGVPLKTVNGLIDSQYQSLLNTTAAILGSKAAAEKYLATLGFVPKEIKTDLKVAAVGVAAAKAAIDAAAADRTATIHIDYTGGGSGGGSGAVTPKKHAAGGWISGPGTGTSDSIHALLSSGEFVVNAASARRYAPMLDQINAGRPPTGGGDRPIQITTHIMLPDGKKLASVVSPHIRAEAQRTQTRTGAYVK